MALPWLSRLNFEVPKEPAALSDEEKALMTDIQEWFEQHERQLHAKAQDEGVKLGRDEGVKHAIGRLFERRLGRPLAEGERGVLADRIERLGEDRVDDVLLGLDTGALAAWLADPAAS